MGWTLARLAAERFETTVVVEERKFGPAIRAWLADNEPPANLTFAFVPEKWWAHGMWAAGLGYLSYRWWHGRARKAAEKLHADRPFDAVQMATIISFREPGPWSDLPAADAPGNVPLIWGPVGGTHNYPAGFLGEAGPKAAMKERIRSWVNRRQLAGRRVREALFKAHTVVAATGETRDALRGVVDRDVAVVSEITLRTPRRDAAFRPLDGGPLRVLWSGLHEPRKCLSLLIRAVAKLPSPEAVTVRVLGDGEMRGRWKALADELGVADRFEWSGWIPHDQAAAQYEWADAFAFTSVRDTTGTVLLEALDAGLPVVTLDHQGAGDVVTADCGIKVTPHSPAAAVSGIGVALTRLAGDESLRRRLSDGAVRRADDYRLDAKRAQWHAVWDGVPSLRACEAEAAREPV